MVNSSSSHRKRVHLRKASSWMSVGPRKVERHSRALRPQSRTKSTNLRERSLKVTSLNLNHCLKAWIRAPTTIRWRVNCASTPLITAKRRFYQILKQWVKWTSPVIIFTTWASRLSRKKWTTNRVWRLTFPSWWKVGIETSPNTT